MCRLVLWIPVGYVETFSLTEIHLKLYVVYSFNAGGETS
jgi:hypothetical protein